MSSTSEWEGDAWNVLDCSGTVEHRVHQRAMVFLVALLELTMVACLLQAVLEYYGRIATFVS